MDRMKSKSKNLLDRGSKPCRDDDSTLNCIDIYTYFHYYSKNNNY